VQQLVAASPVGSRSPRASLTLVSSSSACSPGSSPVLSAGNNGSCSGFRRRGEFVRGYRLVAYRCNTLLSHGRAKERRQPKRARARA
jgi:hypothetical protein